MNPRHGEVWLVDMGMAAKTRPGSQPIRLLPLRLLCLNIPNQNLLAKCKLLNQE
jgi:hypothetical protein